MADDASALSDGPSVALPEAKRTGKKATKFSWRAAVRAIHRDAGHIAVGLTFVYALSGLAVNHIEDWDSNFESYQHQIELGGPIAGSDDEAAAAVMARLDIKDTSPEVYRTAPDDLSIVLGKRTLHVNTMTGHIVDDGQRPRFFLRAPNWLHLNRGKKAWTIIADLYAVGLIVLALTGILMTPGRKGLFGRGGVLILVGALVPILYVQLSGGPRQQSARPPRESAAPR